MLKPTKYILFFILTAFLFSCSSSKKVGEESSNGGAEEVYVFDDIGVYDDHNSVKDTSAFVSHDVSSETGGEYIVQVGAFTSQARAERFVAVNQNKIDFPMQISFSDEVKLFVVQLPPFPSRKDAEKVRDNLWTIDTFRDAFIITR